MAFVLVSAVGLAALRNADEVWAGIILLAALAVVGIAILGAAILRGRERCWWAGFASFGGVYLALAFAPWPGNSSESTLGTTALLRYVHARVTAEPELKVLRINAALALYQVLVGDSPASKSVSAMLTTADPSVSASRVNGWRSLLPGAANYQPFVTVGHSLFALLAGLAGALVACRFYARRERGEAHGGCLSRFLLPRGRRQWLNCPHLPEGSAPALRAA